MKNYLKLIIAIGICELAGVIGSFFTISSVSNWYGSLSKPKFNPPNWIFGPVWVILFALMGTAAFLVYVNNNADSKRKKFALSVFAIQLLFNVLWSIIFFGLKNPGLAFIDIIILLVSIILTIIFFYRISKQTIWFLLPYLLWVAFATYLNFSIWQLSV